MSEGGGVGRDMRDGGAPGWFDEDNGADCVDEVDDGKGGGIGGNGGGIGMNGYCMRCAGGGGAPCPGYMPCIMIGFIMPGSGGNGGLGGSAGSGGGGGGGRGGRGGALVDEFDFDVFEGL